MLVRRDACECGEECLGRLRNEAVNLTKYYYIYKTVLRFISFSGGGQERRFHACELDTADIVKISRAIFYINITTHTAVALMKESSARVCAVLDAIGIDVGNRIRCVTN